MEEIWKDIDGYEGLYQVSSWGRVKSLNYRNQIGKEKIMVPKKDRVGYLGIKLAKGKWHLVHRLVAKAFIPNPLNLPEVNHKTECRMLNFACCLEWCDRSYNINYGTNRKRFSNKVSIPVKQISLDGKLVKIWKSATEAEQIGGFNQTGIVCCCRGRYKSSMGFYWQYA